MENFKKKYLGDKAFYLMVLGVVLPIMIQNGITNFVSLLTTSWWEEWAPSRCRAWR